MNCAICSGTRRIRLSKRSGSIRYSTLGSAASALPERAWLPTNNASSPKYSSGPISLSGRSPANSSRMRPDSITNMLRPNSPRRNTARPASSSMRWPALANSSRSCCDSWRGKRPIAGTSSAEGLETPAIRCDCTLDTTTPSHARRDHTAAVGTAQAMTAIGLDGLKAACTRRAIWENRGNRALFRSATAGEVRRPSNRTVDNVSPAEINAISGPGERAASLPKSNATMPAPEGLVERAQRGKVGILVVGRMEQRAEADHLARIIEVPRQDRHAGLPRDVPEARFPFHDGLAGALGFDPQPQAFARAETFDHLRDHVAGRATLDRHAAQFAQQAAQWPAEQFALGHERNIRTDRDLEQQAVDAVPPRRMRRDDQHRLGDVGEFAFEAPAAQAHRRAERLAPRAVGKLRHRRGQCRGQRRLRRAGIQSSLQARPRLRFTLPRCFLPARRRSFEARVGLVATRFFGGTSAERMISIKRSRASSRLRAWSRKRRAWITSTPSSVNRRSRRASMRARTGSGSDGECA